MTRRLFLLLLCVAVAATTGSALAQSAQTDIVFFLTFVPNIQFSPLYVAIEKGYFADEGLNVTIQHGGEPDGVELIAVGLLQFGVVSGEQVIQARSNGRPVVYVYEWFQKYPVAVVAPDNTGIRSVADLAGRKVGIPERSGASYSGLIALLAANGMTEDELQLEPISFFAPDSICQGNVEAAVVYINNEPLQIQQRADAGMCGDITGLSVFPVSDATDMVSNGIVTSEDVIARDPDLVRAVVRAFDRGLQDAISNPAETYLISTRFVENLPASDTLRKALEEAANSPQTDRDALLASLAVEFAPQDLIQFQVLLSSIDLWEAERPGLSELSSWEVTRDTLITMGFLDAATPLDLTAAFTNDFLPAE